MISNQELEPLALDLSDLRIEEIEVFTQESSRAIPAFAASSCTCSDQSDCCGSCTTEEQ